MLPLTVIEHSCIHIARRKRLETLIGSSPLVYQTNRMAVSFKRMKLLVPPASKAKLTGMLSPQLTRFLTSLYNAIQQLRCRLNTQTKDEPAAREIFPPFADSTV